MTPLSHPDGRLRELIKKWRASAVVQDGNVTCVNHAFYECADELEAFLATISVAQPDRLRELAARQARRNHNADRRNTATLDHPTQCFELCPHPDCVLVRASMKENEK